MKTITPGNQIIDIRNGHYHIVIDKEIFDNITLYYTDKGTAIPSTFVIDTKLLKSSHLILREINNEPVTDWLRNNNEITLSIKVRPDFDANKIWNEIIEKRNKKLRKHNSFWGYLKYVFLSFFR